MVITELNTHISAMKKSNLSGKKKEKWDVVLKSKLMSSEESGEDDSIEFP